MMQFLLSLAFGFLFFLTAILCGIFMYLRFSQNRYVTGKEIPEEKKPVVKQQYIMTVIALIGLGVYFGCFFDYRPFFADHPDAWQTRDNRTMAYVMMQNFVKDNLLNPASAKFEWITEPDCVITKDGFDYKISSWVDAQNQYGVMVRTRFTGIVRQVDKDNWLLLELKSEGLQNEPINNNLQIIQYPLADVTVPRLPIQTIANNFQRVSNGFGNIYYDQWINLNDRHVQVNINPYAALIFSFEDHGESTVTGAMIVYENGHNQAILNDVRTVLCTLMVFFEPNLNSNSTIQTANNFLGQHGDVNMTTGTGNTYFLTKHENITQITIVPNFPD